MGIHQHRFQVMQTVLAAHVLALVFCIRLPACPAGYESPESLVRHSRLIVRLEVLSAQEAPLPPEVAANHRQDHDYGRTAGQARVKILEVLKGECAAHEFTLIGGPWHTCAPSLYYHSFQPGQNLVLILETPLPADVKTVAITWRNRLIEANNNQIKEFMERARAGWKLAVERHRRAVPEEMAKAEVLHAEIAKRPDFQIPASTSYEVLSCLTILLNDPDHLPATVPEDVPEQDRWSGYSNSFFAALYASQGAYVTAYGSHAFLPARMRDVVPKRAEFNYTPPPEAAQFNKKILKSILVGELFVPPALVDSTLKNPDLKTMLNHPNNDPFWLRLDRPRSDHKIGSADTRQSNALALHYLMLLANPEPDGLIWGAFGLNIVEEAAFLPPELFVGFIEHNPQRIFEDRGALMILALLPHPQIAPMIRVHAAKGAYDNWPDVLIRYFAHLGSEPDILNAVSIMERNADQFIKSLGEPGHNSSNDTYLREHYLRESNDALKTLSASGMFKASEQRLRALSKQVATVKTLDEL